MRDTSGYLRPAAAGTRTAATAVALAAVLAIVLAAGCGRGGADASASRASGASSVARPEEVYTAMAPPPVSRVRVPLFVTREAIAGLLDAQLPEVLLEDSDFGGYGVGVSVGRAGAVGVEVSTHDGGPAGVPYATRPTMRARLRVPLTVQVRRRTFLSDLVADGALTVELVTHVSVEPDWSLRSGTELAGYTWTRRPRLSVGGLAVSIEGLTDALLQRMRTRIAAGVDEGIAANASLRPALALIFAQLAQPAALSADYGGYLVPAPHSLGLGRLRGRGGGLATTLEIGLRPRVSLATVAPAVPPVALPQNAGAAPGSDDFEMAIYGAFGYGDMERVLAKALLDTALEAGGRRATVREVEVYGQRERLVIGLRMDGDYRGWAYVRARPSYDADAGSVRLNDLDLRLDTRNLLHRAVAGVFRRRIARLLDEQIGEQVAAQLELVRGAIAEQVAGTEITPGVRLDGEAAALRLEELSVTEEGLAAVLHFRGTLSVTILEFPR